MNNKRLFVIDGNSFCYRAFYAIKSLTNSKGQPTNAVYGFITMLNKLISDETPDLLAVAFDLKGPTFRHERYKEYKITRKPMPDDLRTQIPYIKEVLKAYNICMFEKQGYEADDILATIADKARGRSIDTYIVTGDKDALQLVGPNVRVYNVHRDEIVIYNEEEVKKRFGVEPSRMVDLMALMGDVSDNIPGVPGIGEKTAATLIQEYKTLDNLLENVDKLKSQSQKQILKENIDTAKMSKELAVLDKDVPINVDFDAMTIKEPDGEELARLFRELEFKALLKEVIPDDTIKTKYTIVSAEKAFAGLLKDLKDAETFAFDFETTSTDPMLAEPVGVSFCWRTGTSYYVPISTEKTKEERLDRDYVFAGLKPILEDEKIKKVGQNIKYEMVILANYNIELKGICFDTMVASYLLNPSKLNHNLDDISMEYLNHRMTSIVSLIGKGKTSITMDEVELEKAAKYCSEDSDVTFRLKEILQNLLKEKNLDQLFNDIEIPLVGVLADMEYGGVAIDRKLLSGMSGAMDKSMVSLTKDIYEMAQTEFNINSPKQLSAVLFEKLKLPVVKKTKTGFSTDEEVLNKLASVHALPKTLLEYRELSKLKSTYVDALPRLINPKTNRVHTSFNQTVTQTGRLSSSDPNLQNIPIRTEVGRSIRKAFIADNGAYLLSADYSQIELRILAHLSQDKNLMQAFREDQDIHSYTASLIFSKDGEAVLEDGPQKTILTKDQQRSIAKTVNFGIIYGMSSYGLSKDLDIPVEKAQEFIDSYFQRYPGVKVFIDSQIDRARKEGFVTTIFNRRRYMPEINSKDMRMRQFAERTAINAPVQGSAADLIKAAMIDIHNELKKKKLTSSMILQVHDELVFEVPETELDTVKDLVRDKMENAIRLDVPVKVNIDYGKNWLQMQPVN